MIERRVSQFNFVVHYCSTYYKVVCVGGGTRKEPGTITQGSRVRLFSLVALVWESNPKLQGGWFKTEPPAHPDSGTIRAGLF